MPNVSQALWLFFSASAFLEDHGDSIQEIETPLPPKKKEKKQEDMCWEKIWALSITKKGQAHTIYKEGVFVISPITNFYYGKIYIAKSAILTISKSTAQWY